MACSRMNFNLRYIASDRERDALTRQWMGHSAHAAGTVATARAQRPSCQPRACRGLI
jgi:hypothetical protein